MLVAMLMLAPSVDITPFLIHVISGVGAALPSQVRTTLPERCPNNVSSGDLISVGVAVERKKQVFAQNVIFIYLALQDTSSYSLLKMLSSGKYV